MSPLRSPVTVVTGSQGRQKLILFEPRFLLVLPVSPGLWVGLGGLREWLRRCAQRPAGLEPFYGLGRHALQQSLDRLSLFIERPEV